MTRPFSARVVGATLLVAGVTACTLSAAAAVTARVFWEQQESRRVAESARALAAAIRTDRSERVRCRHATFPQHTVIGTGVRLQAAVS